MDNILITGGAGFVGSNLAIHLKNAMNCRVFAFDNLHRRGSELSLPRLKKNGVEFIHGDTRMLSDLNSTPKSSVIIDASAEPSVLAGIDGNTEFLTNTNLNGTLNCLDLAKKHHAQFIFLSTSRVYPVDRLLNIKYTQTDTRFQISSDQSEAGISPAGISENLNTSGPRTLYGTTKLASELLVEEYGYTFGIPTVINRCGVIAGPWQMGKIDQGVIALWIARHIFKSSLQYIGFGGSGKQVRDVIHIHDLANLVQLEISNLATFDKQLFNVGGGTDCSCSLLELTALCEEITGNKIAITSTPETRPGDIPLYISDCQRLFSITKWRPQKTLNDIIADTAKWITDNQSSLRDVLG